MISGKFVFQRFYKGIEISEFRCSRNDVSLSLICQFMMTSPLKERMLTSLVLLIMIAHNP